MNYPIALVYIGFFGLVGLAVWITENPLCLLALFLTPSYNDNDNSDDAK